MNNIVDIRHIVVGMFPLHVLKGELCTFSLDIFTSPSCYLAHGQREILQIPIHCLLLNQRGDPEDDDGTNDGCAELTKNTAPGDAKQVEQPATKDTAEETQHTIHDEAIAATFHQLASAEASQTSKKE